MLRFELGYQLNSWAVPIFTLCYFGFAYLVGSQGASPAGVNYNSDYELFFKMGLLSLGCVFSIMFLVVAAIQRDRVFLTEPLIFSTPISKAEFFFSRFLGVWIMAVIILLLAIPGFYAGVYFSDLDPLRMSHYTLLSPLSVAWKLLIPTVTTCTALIFVVSLLSRNSLATYSTAILIYVAYFICAIFLNSPLIANSAPIPSENLLLAALADPFGLSAFFEQTNRWTSYQKNTTPISFLGLFAWNRILWIAISIGLMSFAYWKFSFRKEHGKKAEKNILHNENHDDPSKRTRTEPKIGGYLQSIPSTVRMELSFVFKSPPFWLVSASWVILAIIEIHSRIYAGGQYRESLYPASQILLELVQQPLQLFTLVLLVFYTGELVWRAKDAKFHEILGATPSPGGFFYLSTLLSLAALIALQLVLTLGICFSFQIVQGYFSLESFALASLILSPGISLACYSILMLIIHHFSKNKYLGMGISIVAVALFSGPLGNALNVHHPLLKIGHTPFLIYSQQAGFSINLNSFLLLSLIWMLLALIISLYLFNNWRGSLPRKPVTGSWENYSNTLLPGLLLIGLVGFSFYQINVVAGYQTMSELLEKQHQYELNYKAYQNQPVLAYSSLDMKVDLYPSEGTYYAHVQGKLKNTGLKPVSTLLMTEKEKLNKVSIDRIRSIQKDENLQVYTVHFTSPIAPGEEVAFSFEVLPKAGIFNAEKSVVKDGSYLNFRDFAPYFGYSQRREITNNQERKKRKLPPKQIESGFQEHTEELEQNLIKVDFEAVISTESPQFVITSGDHISTKQDNTRTIYHYQSNQKILPVIAFFSGNYQVDSIQTGEVNLAVYSIPEHQAASIATLEFMEKTLRYASSKFASYPFQDLKIVEVPAHWGFGGFAHSGVISMVEDNFFLIKPATDDQFDVRAKRTIHEVAHQWFGHLLAPRNIPGASLFVEGLAKYTEALVMEQEFGKAAIWHLTDNSNRTYFSGKANASEPESSLANMQGQSYLAYGKSLLSLLAMRELLGEEKLNASIKNMITNSSSNEVSVVSMHDFLTDLKSGASSEEIELIKDSFERIIRYDLKIDQATVATTGNGKYKVNVSYSAKKLQTLDDGSEIEIPMNEKITIACLSRQPRVLTSSNEVLLSEKVYITSGTGEFHLILDQKPNWISIDPWGTKPDPIRADNDFSIDLK